MSLLEGLKLWWHERKVRRKMDRVFSRGEDPYNYLSSPYEKARLTAMEGVIGGRRKRVLEVGCAEGAFTEKLAPMAGEVVGVDVSPVALNRARKRFSSRPHVWFHEGDIRKWDPGRTFDLIVLGDVLYYLDKPGVQDEFERTFARVAGWLEPRGRLVLAHGFAGPERGLREGYRKRFEKLGLKLVSERVVGEGEKDGKVCCLLSVLEK